MASHTTTSVADILKELYPSEDLPKVMYEVAPTLALMPKWEKFGGNTFRETLVYRYNQGRSATFATAQTNATSAAVVGFDVSRASNYAIATIDSELIEATQGDKDALIDGVELAMDGSLLELSKSYGIQLFRTTTGSRGAISAGSDVGTATITLATIEDVTNFEVGMVVAAKAADTAGAVRVGTNTITAIDRDAGTLTTTTSWATGIAAVAAGDSLYVAGDKDFCLAGITSWVPVLAPDSTAFFGIDRSVDTRLQGHRLVGTTFGLEEALLKIQSLVCREGGTPDLIVVNNKDYNNLDIGMGSKVEYNRDGKRPAMGGGGRVDDIGFDTLRLMGDKGPIDIVADPFAPKGHAFCLTTKSWKFRTLGACPRVLGKDEYGGDGLSMLRQATVDGNEIRLVGRGNLSCNAPGFNGRISLQAL